MRKFFRIELDKTGAILSCSEVEASEKGGKFVRYVEALDAAGACEQVNAWWAARKAAHRASGAARVAARRAAGVCIDCAKPAVVGRARCSAHMRANYEGQLRAIARSAGESVPRMRAPTAESAQQALARSRLHGARAVAKNGRHTESAYRRCLAHFDKLSPKQFRAWLVGKISALEAKRLAKKEAA
jgi:hypothetical protein